MATVIRLCSVPNNYVLLASERDTYRGNTIENQGCLLASE